MYLIRPARIEDLDQLFDLIQRSEEGMTSLKLSKEGLLDRIESSTFSFERTVHKVSGLPYVFVLTEPENRKIVGTCMIYSKVGGFEPLYAYRIEKSIHKSDELNVHKEIDTLHLYRQHDGPTEIGGLFLDPEYWGKGLGKLLSLCRFLFMAEFPSRFDETTIAEMRGVIDKNGRSPLWDAIGSHFFQIEFPRAVMEVSKSKNFVADLMPKHPIYLPLLPQEARDAIATVHRNTRPALAMLESQGFVFQSLVDIFDGGPIVHCKTSEIKTVTDSMKAPVKIIDEKIEGKPSLISNCSQDFRVCQTVFGKEGEHALVDRKTAEALNVENEQMVRILLS